MLPGRGVRAPADAAELRRMVATAIAYEDGPIAFRFPRGEIAGQDQPGESRPLDIGKGRLVREGVDAAILSFGARLEACLEAAAMLAGHGFSVSVADSRFAKPLDVELLEGLARHHPLLVTVEDGAIGGFSAQVMHHLTSRDLLQTTRFRALTLPDRFIAHGSPTEQYADARLDAGSICETILAALLRT